MIAPTTSRVFLSLSLFILLLSFFLGVNAHPTRPGHLRSGLRPSVRHYDQPANHNAVSSRSASLDVAVYQGQGTFFDPGQGACGSYAGRNDSIVALNKDQYGNVDAYSPDCFRTIQITNTANGRTANAIIQDACPTCAYGALDLSPFLFGVLAESFDQGIIPLMWYYTDMTNDSGSVGYQDSEQSQSQEQGAQFSASSPPTSSSTSNPNPSPSLSPSPNSNSSPSQMNHYAKSSLGVPTNNTQGNNAGGIMTMAAATKLPSFRLPGLKAHYRMTPTGTGTPPSHVSKPTAASASSTTPSVAIRHTPHADLA